MLLSSDPEYSEQDRSALPTFPASKDDLFGYDVVIFGDADTSFLSHSQMQNLVQFVTEKGGGVLFVAGENFNPLTYRGTPAGSAPPRRAGADARNPTAAVAGVTSYRPELTLEGRSNPIFRLGDNEVASMEIWNRLPELYWYFEAPRKKPAAQVLAEHPTAIGPEGKLPLIVYQFLGVGQGDVPRVRRHLAVAVPRRRPVLRAVLGADHPLHGPIAPDRQSPGGDPDRPPPLSAGPADPVAGPLPQPRPRAGR